MILSAKEPQHWRAGEVKAGGGRPSGLHRLKGAFWSSLPGPFCQPPFCLAPSLRAADVLRDLLRHGWGCASTKDLRGLMLEFISNARRI